MAQHVAPSTATTAWESIPKPIRFVVWLYAVLTILALIGAPVTMIVTILLTLA